jgi:integrase
MCASCDVCCCDVTRAPARRSYDRTIARRRSYGTGSLFVRRTAAGQETWYVQFWVGGRQVKRALGKKRVAATSDGLTRTQAEAALRRLVEEAATAPPPTERVGVAEAGERYLHHLKVVMQRKPTTIHDYKIILNRHLIPFFGDRSLERVKAEDVIAFMAAKQRDGLSYKTINNILNFFHGLFRYSMKRGWTNANPVAAVDRPRDSGADPDIRFLDLEEFEALLRAVPEDLLGPTELVLYRAAGMTGLRQGELVALRWRDVDWGAGVIRVRRNYTRGEFGTPKSRRSSRAVPMADRLATELENHFQASAYQGDDGLVFAHPQTGHVLDASKMRKRYKEALARAGLREVRFHDLRHTFGTHMAAAGAPLRAIQEWMGHRDYKTTLVYADYAPDSSQGRVFAEKAFGGPAVGSEDCAGAASSANGLTHPA